MSERGNLVILAAYVLVGVATYLVARMLLQEQEVRQAEENLADQRDRKASNPLVRITRPFFSQYVVPMIRGKAFWDERRKIVRRKLIAAGLKDELTADEFIAFKFFQVLFFPILGGLIRALDFYELQIWQILGLGVIGWFYPDFWVNSRIQTRHKAIRKALPFVVDLLALSTEAGMDFMGAMAKVVEKARPSPLIEELEQILKQVKIGSSRAEALREFGLRVDMSEVNSFVAILISSDQMGASIGKVLRQQSDQVRSERFTAAEKAGARASQLIILPIVIFIVPAVMIMIIGPLILNVVGGS